MSKEEMEKRYRELQERRANDPSRRKSEPTNVVQFPAAPANGIPDELKEAISDLDDEKEALPQEILSADQELEQFVRGIGVLEAYRKWIGGKEVTSGNGYLAPPEYRIQCPLPDHTDSKPSASLNTDTNLWVCYGCDNTGGDILDLAAIHHGMYPDYKNGQGFHNLFRKIGEDYGWKVENRGGIPTPVSPAEQVKKFEAAEQRIIEAQLAQHDKGELPPSNVIDIETGEEPYDEPFIEDFSDMPSLDWKPLVKEGTFLDHYMSECTKDTSPEEYHFWNALLALSLAAGRNVQLNRLKGNLFICLLGKSGVGKGMSWYPLTQVLKSVMPFDEKNPSQDGVFIINGIQTGEGLVKDFMGEYSSPGKPPVIAGNIKGLVRWDEMATVVINSKRGNGNIIKTKMNEFYDCSDEISTRAASGSRTAINPYACVLTSLQPDNLRDGLSKEDVTSGFLNRFFFVTGTRKPQKAIDEHEYDFSLINPALTQIRLWYKKWDQETMEPIPTKLTFDGEARTLWTDFHDRVVDPTVANGSGSVSRINSLMRKLIMLFAVNAMETVISKDTVERAIKMWDYLLQSYTAVDSRVSKSLMSELMDDILDVSNKLQATTKAGVKYITPQIISKHRGKYELRDISIALEELCRAGLMQKFDTESVNKRKGRGAPIKGLFCYLPVPMGDSA